jgi:hypothetical protein
LRRGFSQTDGLLLKKSRSRRLSLLNQPYHTLNPDTSRQQPARYFFRIRPCFPADFVFPACAVFGSSSSDSGCHSRCTSSPNDPSGSRFRFKRLSGRLHRQKCNGSEF